MSGSRPRLTPLQWTLIAVVVFVVAAVVADVVTSLPGSLARSGGPVDAQLNGRLPTAPLRVGQAATLALALVVTGTGTMSPACVAGNLTPALRVVRVTILDTRSSRWSHGESCGGILESQAAVPVVLRVVPRFPGRYTLRLFPAVHRRRVGTGVTGTLVVRPASG